eukprot:scaffold5791_cov117-Isochrysis_galbana.AAC.4
MGHGEVTRHLLGHDPTGRWAQRTPRRGEAHQMYLRFCRLQSFEALTQPAHLGLESLIERVDVALVLLGQARHLPLHRVVLLLQLLLEEPAEQLGALMQDGLELELLRRRQARLRLSHGLAGASEGILGPRRQVAVLAVEIALLEILGVGPDAHPSGHGVAQSGTASRIAGRRHHSR